MSTAESDATSALSFEKRRAPEALSFKKRRPRPDAVVVNPPRRGIGAELADALEDSGVPTVLYSSCNPATLAQDLARMPSYRVARVQVDQEITVRAVLILADPRFG